METVAYIVCRNVNNRILATEYAFGGLPIELVKDATVRKPGIVELEGATTVRIFMNYKEALVEANVRCYAMGERNTRLAKIKVDTDDVRETPYGDEVHHRTSKFCWDCLCVF